jgi:DNA-binding CsgD family transcriptional regulator
MPRPRLPKQRKLLGAAILSDHAWSEIAKALRITTREVQIIQGVFDNLTQKGIASRLDMKEHTAHTHLNRLFKKLNTTTRTALVLRIVEQLIALTLAETGVLPPICPRHQRGACPLRSASARAQKA